MITSMIHMTAMALRMENMNTLLLYLCIDLKQFIYKSYWYANMPIGTLLNSLSFCANNNNIIIINMHHQICSLQFVCQSAVRLQANTNDEHSTHTHKYIFLCKYFFVFSAAIFVVVVVVRRSRNFVAVSIRFRSHSMGNMNKITAHNILYSAASWAFDVLLTTLFCRQLNNALTILNEYM